MINVLASKYLCSSTLRKYYPIRLVPKSHWIDDTYCAVYMKQNGPTQKKAESFTGIMTFAPSFVFGTYWLMLGPMDWVHITIASALGVQLLRSSIARVLNNELQLQKLFLHKNGIDWVAAINPTIAGTKNDHPELKLQLKIGPELQVITFTIYDVKEAMLTSKDKDQRDEIQVLSDFQQEEFNTVNILVRTGDTKRKIQFDIRENSIPQYNDFIKPLLKQQIIQFPAAVEKP